MKFDLNNRRYIGNKFKLLERIDTVIKENINLEEGMTFYDPFAGTGVVSKKYYDEGLNIIVNDLLYSNYVIYRCWFDDLEIDMMKLENIISRFNEVDSSDIPDNYFSEIYSDKYFSKEDAKVIGFIREEIEILKNTLNEREYYYLVTSLLYTVDRIANTVGHFEHYLKARPEAKGVVMKHINIGESLEKGCVKAYNKDANKLTKKIGKVDIVYIDPPYNARQYINFYHVLENLAKWDKPTEFEGKSMKFKRDHLKSGYSQVSATELFRELISDLNAKLIVVSYNNTYNAKSSASNNKISQEDMEQILAEKGKLIVYEEDYKSFNAGKTNFSNHKELIYVCKVF